MRHCCLISLICNVARQSLQIVFMSEMIGSKECLTFCAVFFWCLSDVLLKINIHENPVHQVHSNFIESSNNNYGHVEKISVHAIRLIASWLNGSRGCVIIKAVLQHRKSTLKKILSEISQTEKCFHLFAALFLGCCFKPGLQTVKKKKKKKGR